LKQEKIKYFIDYGMPNMTFLFYFQPFLLDGYFITQNERSIRFMKKMLKRLCTGFLALATVVTALPTTPVHAESKQYWTESKERVGIVEKVMNDGSIGSTFNEGHLTVEGEDAYCIDINTDFKNGYKTRADVSTRMSADQISDVALSIEYVKQYTDSHRVRKPLSKKIKDAMNVAVISTLARGRNWDNSGRN